LAHSPRPHQDILRTGIPELNAKLHRATVERLFRPVLLDSLKCRSARVASADAAAGAGAGTGAGAGMGAAGAKGAAGAAGAAGAGAAAGVEDSDAPAPPVAPHVALFLLTEFLLIFAYKPLVNQVGRLTLAVLQVEVRILPSATGDPPLGVHSSAETADVCSDETQDP
jgi:hypothetical protein